MSTVLRVFVFATYLYFMMWLAVVVLLFAIVGRLDPILIGSGSMSPLIRAGDVVLIRPPASLEAASRLGPGTVITFRNDGLGYERLVTHRIFAVSTDGTYITKGDANAGPDSDAVRPGDVVGVGRILVPMVGLPAVWVADGHWVPLFVWLGATIFALFSVSSPRRRGPPDEDPPDDASGEAPTFEPQRERALLAPLLRLVLVVSLVGVVALLVSATHAAFSATSSNPGNVLTAVEWHAVIDLDGGETHACLVRGEGYVWCWGRNDKGQLGDGSTIDRWAPVEVKGPGGTGILSDVESLASGAKFNCAATDPGAVWCWGENSDGQLGDNTKTNRATPVQVKGSGGVGALSDIVDVAAGESFACGVTSAGSVWCWGRNDKGQLGNTTTTDSLTPVQVRGSGGSGTLTDVVSITAGLKFACAVKADASVWCWGENNEGQLGNATTTNSSYPVQVRGAGGSGSLTGVAGAAAGESFACAVKSDGSAWCWGRNDKGQLGDATTTDRLVPVQVKGAGGSGVLTGAVKLAAGQKHACAVRNDGSVWCWGLNNKGQLGNDTTSDSAHPVQVKGPGGVGTLANAVIAGAGNLFSCAARADYTVWCWGDNSDGQLGDNTTNDHHTPVQLKGGGWTGVFTDAVGPGGGGDHTCAVKDDETVWCWGRNDKGQLGNNTTTDSEVPVQVTGPGGSGTLTGVVSVAAGVKSTCAVKNDGSVWCWGENNEGQLGNNTTTNSSSPVQVKGPGGAGTLSGVVAVAAGEQFACAVKNDGTVWCWGRNDKGQLGDATTTDRLAPVQVKGPGGSGTLTGAVAVTAGMKHACAVKSDGSVWCWGLNDKGQLGDATTTDRSWPVQVKGPGGSGTLSGAVYVEAGERSTCVRKTDGTVWCWGLNDKGQLGDATTTNRPAPVQVKGPGGTGTLSGVDAIAVGLKHACALKSDGTVWCWGLNDKGQLGDATTTNRSAPVQVKGPGSGTFVDGAAIGAGDSHSCATNTDGYMWCWGSNNEGQLGDGTTSDSSTPRQVL